MDRNRIMEIMDVQDTAFTDKAYMQLRVDYTIAQERFCRLMTEMSPREQEIVADYLLTAVSLHQRLMELAIDYGRASGG